MRRRTAALGLSLLLHLTVLAVLLARSDADESGDARAIEVEYVGGAELSAPDQRLPAPAEDPRHDGFDAAPLQLDKFAFDLAKIHSRENALFPFLTLDLLFLDRVTHDLREAQQRLVSPFAPVSSGGDAPPLEMSNDAMQQLIDRAWSRRERWKSFTEIVALLSSHDPNRGRAPEVIRGYLDQNILQLYCDGTRHDPRFWAMLENVADHADFVDFIRGYTRQHPSSKTTTELLFLLDELAQGSRDVIFMLLDTRPDRDLSDTRTMRPEAYQAAGAIKDRYGRWLFDRGMDKRALRRHYDELRLRLLQTIAETTPNGYRIGDARFLAGQVLFEMNRLADAEQVWRSMSPAIGDAYYQAASEVLDALRSGSADARSINRILGNEYGRWRLFSIDRLRHFGHHCDTF